MSKWRRVDACTCGPDRMEHADGCPVVKMIEDSGFGIGAIQLEDTQDEPEEPEYAEDEYNGLITGR